MEQSWTCTSSINDNKAPAKTKKSYFSYMTKTGAAAPAVPTAGDISALEAAIAVIQRLPPAATRQRPELVDVELVSNPLQQHDSRKRRPASPSSPCHSSTSAICSSIAAKRTRRC
jgi:hypothetical protein